MADVHLIRVEHERCSEWEGYEYFVAPDKLSKDQVAMIVDDIVREQIEDAKAVQLAPEAPKTFQVDFRAHPDKLVREVIAEHETAKAAHERWKHDHPELLRSFADRMRDRGLLPITDINKDDSVIANWGHNHGLDLKYHRSNA